MICCDRPPGGKFLLPRGWLLGSSAWLAPRLYLSGRQMAPHGRNEERVPGDRPVAAPTRGAGGSHSPDANNLVHMWDGSVLWAGAMTPGKTTRPFLQMQEARCKLQRITIVNLF